jgi:surface carbohydrate biosynthesis protein
MGRIVKLLFIFFNYYFSAIKRKHNKCKKKNFYVLYEIFGRDYISRLIIACKLAKIGNVLLLPFNTFTRISNILPSGIVLSKGIVETKNFNKILDKHHVYNLTEEQIINNKNNIEIKSDLDVKTYKKIKKSFLWGNKQKKDYLKITNIYNNNNTIISGSPRFELLMSQKYLKIFSEERRDIKNKYSKFIIVSSNFGSFTYENHPTTEADFIAKQQKIPLTKSFSNKWEEFKKYKYQSALYFIKLVEYLKKNIPEVNIILRPHPSDNLDFWYKRLPREQVIYKYSSIPWILESDCLIHHHCTTSIEAFFLRKNSICYSPIINKGFGENIYFNTSIVIREREKMLELINNIIFKKYKIFSKKSFRELNNNIKINKNSSINIITNNLKRDEIKTKNSNQIFKALYCTYKIMHILMILAKKMNIFYQEKKPFYGKKNYGTDIAMIIIKLKKFLFIKKITKINNLNDEIFYIE